MRAGAFVAACIAAAVLTGTGVASAPPVGPIGHAQVTSVTTKKGSLVAIALPSKTGYDWRIARSLDASIVREVSEANVGANVVLVFKAVGSGHAKIVVAQTRGERSKVYQAVEYDVRVQ